MVKFVFISGPPGSGKSTQAKLISDYLGYGFFDTGDMVRRLIADGTLKMGDRLAEGFLMPEKQTLIYAKRELGELLEKENKGFVISGIPRSHAQAIEIDGEEGIVKWLTGKFSKGELLFINLEIPEGESIKRNLARHQGRVDDRMDVLKTRLKVFKETTLPSFEELKKLGYRVIKIDGRPSIETVFENIKKHLE